VKLSHYFAQQHFQPITKKDFEVSHTTKLAKLLIAGEPLTNLKAMRICRATSAERRLREIKNDLSAAGITISETWEDNKNGGRHKVWWLAPSARKQAKKHLKGLGV
jgi:hypothetical protein